MSTTSFALNAVPVVTFVGTASEGMAAAPYNTSTLPSVVVTLDSFASAAVTDQLERLAVAVLNVIMNVCVPASAAVNV